MILWEVDGSRPRAEVGCDSRDALVETAGLTVRDGEDATTDSDCSLSASAFKSALCFRTYNLALGE